MSDKDEGGEENLLQQNSAKLPRLIRRARDFQKPAVHSESGRSVSPAGSESSTGSGSNSGSSSNLSSYRSGLGSGSSSHRGEMRNDDGKHHRHHAKDHSVDSIKYHRGKETASRTKPRTLSQVQMESFKKFNLDFQTQMSVTAENFIMMGNPSLPLFYRWEEDVQTFAEELYETVEDMFRKEEDKAAEEQESRPWSMKHPAEEKEKPEKPEFRNPMHKMGNDMDDLTTWLVVTVNNTQSKLKKVSSEIARDSKTGVRDVHKSLDSMAAKGNLLVEKNAKAIVGDKAEIDVESMATLENTVMLGPPGLLAGTN